MCFFFAITILSISPDTDQKNSNVPTIPSIIGIKISIELSNSLTPTVTK
ncbi:MAG: hypothetical protein ACLRR3_13295 [Eubacterium sp.]